MSGLCGDCDLVGVATSTLLDDNGISVYAIAVREVLSGEATGFLLGMASLSGLCNMTGLGGDCDLVGIASSTLIGDIGISATSCCILSPPALKLHS